MQSAISAMDVLQHNNLLHEVNQCAWCNVQRDVTCSESQYIGRRSVTHMILTHHEKEAFSFLQHLMTEERTVIFTVTFWTEQRKTEPVTTTRPKKTWDSRMETLPQNSDAKNWYCTTPTVPNPTVLNINPKQVTKRLQHCCYSSSNLQITETGRTVKALVATAKSTRIRGLKLTESTLLENTAVQRALKQHQCRLFAF